MTRQGGDQAPRMTAQRDADRRVTVCAECLRASCWHGEFMCDKSRGADVTTRTVRELDALGYEHAEHYSSARVREVEGA
jgi:hypothetical protein